MKELIRNYRGKSYLDQVMTLRQAFSDIQPADLGAEIALGERGTLTVARSMIEDSFRLLHDLLVYAYLSKRIASECCDEYRRMELVNCLEDKFFEVDKMVSEVGSTLAYDGCEEVAK